jgi:hypothetical protein
VRLSFRHELAETGSKDSAIGGHGLAIDASGNCF